MTTAEQLAAAKAAEAKARAVEQVARLKRQRLTAERQALEARTAMEELRRELDEALAEKQQLADEVARVRRDTDERLAAAEVKVGQALATTQATEKPTRRVNGAKPTPRIAPNSTEALNGSPPGLGSADVAVGLTGPRPNFLNGETMPDRSDHRKEAAHG